MPPLAASKRTEERDGGGDKKPKDQRDSKSREKRAGSRDNKRDGSRDRTRDRSRDRTARDKSKER